MRYAPGKSPERSGESADHPLRQAEGPVLAATTRRNAQNVQFSRQGISTADGSKMSGRFSQNNARA
jgi:hypothetical protein